MLGRSHTKPNWTGNTRVYWQPSIQINFIDFYNVHETCFATEETFLTVILDLLSTISFEELDFKEVLEFRLLSGNEHRESPLLE